MLSQNIFTFKFIVISHIFLQCCILTYIITTAIYTVEVGTVVVEVNIDKIRRLHLKEVTGKLALNKYKS